MKLAVWSLALVLAGCPAAPSASGPSLSITRPEEGAVDCGDPLLVEVTIDGFRLTGAGEVGDGHVDFSLNGQSVAMVAGLEVELPEVEDGSYVFRAELVSPEHQPLEPPSFDEIRFEVAASACGARR